MQLNKSNVLFDPVQHTYSLYGKNLKGITGVLSKHLFPAKYDNIPDYILKNAAERGHLIHSNCEIADCLNVVPDCIEAQNYIKIKAEYNLHTIANEYIVTDAEYYASPIDVVFNEGNNTVSLADIKTTYSFDKDYVSWQLSIYAYLFEKQNPHLKVGKLYGIWLRGSKNELIEVNRKPGSVIADLLQCDKANKVFTNPYPVKTNTDVPQQVLEVESYICEIDSHIKELSEKKETILSGLLGLMVEHDVDNWKGNKIQLIRKKPCKRESIDSKVLKEKYPEIYEEVLKTSNVKGSITLKIL